MARRRKEEPLLDLVIRLPWWAGAAAAVVMLILREFVVAAAPANSPYSALYVEGSYFLYFLAALFALGALGSLARQRWHGILLDRQKGHETIDRLSWREFERVLQEAFRRQGYLSVETASGPDGGYDIALRKDGKRYLVQCKHWKSRKVDVKVVRELWGVVAASGAAGGFVVTSGGFTTDARSFAKTVNLELIDGYALKRMIAAVGKQWPERVDPNLSASPSCPKCGREMVKRIARKGSNAGKSFWGCSNFPKCYGLLPVEGD